MIGATVRSYLFGGVGVLAVAGLVTSAMCGLYIKKQESEIRERNTRIEFITRDNKSKDAVIADMVQQAKTDKDTLDKLYLAMGVIDAKSDAQSLALNELRASNAEIRAFLDQPIPADLRRLLKEGGYAPAASPGNSQKAATR